MGTLIHSLQNRLPALGAPVRGSFDAGQSILGVDEVGVWAPSHPSGETQGRRTAQQDGYDQEPSH